MERICRYLLAILPLLIVPSALAQTASTTFYGIAHQDDWQFFDSPNAIYDAANPGNKTVFIYFTAGDAGCGTGCPSALSNVPYFQAREDAASSCVRFAATLNASVSSGSTSTVVINRHSIRRYVYGTTVSYFLRIPDGNVDGTGYPATGHQSLLRLSKGQISSLTAIDHSTTYSSWTDLTNTLNALIRSEAQGSSNVWINTHDPSSTTNPNDHPDHYYSGMAMQAAVKLLPCVNQALFVDYSKASLSGNLTTIDSNLQAANVSVYESGLVDHGFNSGYEYDSRWLGREYFRVIKGSGSCATQFAAH